MNYELQRSFDRRNNPLANPAFKVFDLQRVLFLLYSLLKSPDRYYFRSCTHTFAKISTSTELAKAKDFPSGA